MKASSHSLSWTPSHQLSSSCRCWGSLLGDPYPHWTESSAERRERGQRGWNWDGEAASEGEVQRRGGDEGKKDRAVEKYAWRKRVIMRWEGLHKSCQAHKLQRWMWKNIRLHRLAGSVRRRKNLSSFLEGSRKECRVVEAWFGTDTIFFLTQSDKYFIALA